MLFFPCLKLNVHHHLSKFKGFFTSQHVVRDTLMTVMKVALAPTSLFPVLRNVENKWSSGFLQKLEISSSIIDDQHCMI